MGVVKHYADFRWSQKSQKKALSISKNVTYRFIDFIHSIFNIPLYTLSTVFLKEFVFITSFLLR